MEHLPSTAVCILDYIKTLSYEVGIKAADGISLLSKQFDTLSEIKPTCALFPYLSGVLYPEKSNTSQPYFPFGFNISQKSATKKALENQFSIIEGPPGTGKTQTILNILANAIMQNKTVAVVSNNNAATDNVCEKLQKHNLSFLVATLGHRENKEKFFSNQVSEYPDISHWKLCSAHISYLKLYLKFSGAILDILLIIEKKLAQAQCELANLSTEVHYYKESLQHTYTSAPDVPFPFFISVRNILKLWVQYQFALDSGKDPLSVPSIKLYSWLHITPETFFTQDPDAIIMQLQYSYYQLKKKKLIKVIRTYKWLLKSFTFSSSSKNHQYQSMKLFKGMLHKRFSDYQRPIFANSVLYSREFKDFIQEYPVILSSTHSLKKCIPKDYLLDYVIVDEASQVDIVTGSLVLSCAKNIVVVGDTQQLPNIISDEERSMAINCFRQFKIKNLAYDHASQSFLSSCITLFEAVPKTMLREHYRCHPKIIEFCNQRFYNGQLIVLSENQSDNPIILYQTAPGNHARKNENQRQIEVILNEIIPQQKIDPLTQSVGVISPYRRQTDSLKSQVSPDQIEIDTVHKFQGREKDVIILSTVSNQVNAFIARPDLLNVAVSRAINQFIILTADDNSFTKGNSSLADLIRYIKYNNFDICKSQLCSVFDLLYSNYSEQLRPLLKRLKNRSEYKSENIMDSVISDVLSANEFRHLQHVLHIPLRALIQDDSLLTPEERTFSFHPNTHVDFLIFTKVDKRPILVVEVDGYQFHEADPQQLQRDEKKDRILKKYNIPLIRFATTGSDEKTRLIAKLKSIT